MLHRKRQKVGFLPVQFQASQLNIFAARQQAELHQPTREEWISTVSRGSFLCCHPPFSYRQLNPCPDIPVQDISRKTSFVLAVILNTSPVHLYIHLVGGHPSHDFVINRNELPVAFIKKAYPIATRQRCNYAGWIPDKVVKKLPRPILTPHELATTGVAAPEKKKRKSSTNTAGAENDPNRLLLHRMQCILKCDVAYPPTDLLQSFLTLKSFLEIQNMQRQKGNLYENIVDVQAEEPQLLERLLAMHSPPATLSAVSLIHADVKPEPQMMDVENKTLRFEPVMQTGVENTIPLGFCYYAITIDIHCALNCQLPYNNFNALLQEIVHVHELKQNDGKRNAGTAQLAEWTEQETKRRQLGQRSVQEMMDLSNRPFTIQPAGATKLQQKQRWSDLQKRAQLNISLRDYQLQTVEWMIERETTHSGIHYDFLIPLTIPGLAKPVPTTKKAASIAVMQDRKVWYAPILQCVYSDPPSSVKGGFICEEMGLGKTMEILALINANPAAKNRKRDDGITMSNSSSLLGLLSSSGKTQVKSKTKTHNKKKNDEIEDSKTVVLPVKIESSEVSDKLPQVRATLIITPPSLGGQLQNEFKEKSRRGLKVFTWYGAKRKQMDPKLFDRYDVVITTLNILTREFDIAKSSREKIAREKQEQEDLAYYKKLASDGIPTVADAVAIADHQIVESKESKEPMLEPKVNKDDESKALSLPPPPPTKLIKSVLHGVEWHRIIIDESQKISRNKPEALMQLSSERRWLLSGTPLTKSPADLQSQLSFLGISRYYCPWQTMTLPLNVPISMQYMQALDPESLKLMNRRQRSLAMRQHQSQVEHYPKLFRYLHILFNTTMIRHVKNQPFGDRAQLLSLPQRTIRMVRIAFSKKEAKVYKQMLAHVQNDLERLMGENEWLKCLQNLQPLRLFTSGEQECVPEWMQSPLPSLEPAPWPAGVPPLLQPNITPKEQWFQDIYKSGYASSSSSSAVPEHNAVMQPYNDPKGECVICFEVMTEPLQTMCGHVFCAECIYNAFFTSDERQDNHNPDNNRPWYVREDILRRTCACPYCRQLIRHEDLFVPLVCRKPAVVMNDVESKEEKEEENKDKQQQQQRGNIQEYGRKIQTLMKLLLRIQKEEKPAKALVFSQFAGTLNLVKTVLKSKPEQFQVFALTTQMDMNRRKKELDAFIAYKDKKRCAVFLISTKSSVGLTLSAANHIVMMDPCMNAALEQQAINRVHRIGQSRPVTIHYLLMKNSIEENIVRLNQLRFMKRPNSNVNNNNTAENPLSNESQKQLLKFGYLSMMTTAPSEDTPKTMSSSFDAILLGSQDQQFAEKQEERTLQMKLLYHHPVPF